LLTDVLLDESAIARTGRRGAVVANLCMPIYDTDAPGSPLIGIMKVSFDAGWVVEQLESAVSPGYAAAEIWLVNASGTRVIELTEGERRLPVVPNTLMERIRSGQRGWIKDSPIKGRELVGFAEVKMRRGRIASDVEWYVIVAASREEALGPLYRLAWYVVVGGICLVTLCFLAGWFIARREIIEPLMALRHGAAELERGNVGYRLELSPQNASVFRQDEIGQLARDFNRMADELQRNLTRLETADEVKRQFIDLASHELRTPVTYILGVAQLAQRTNSSEAPLLAKIAVKAARLSRIVENMFKLVSSGTWDARLRMTEVDVAFLLQGVIQELEPFMRERRQTLTTDVAPDLPKILADGEKIRDVLANLLSNAVRFSPDGQNISVRIQAKDNGVFLSVHNPGPGISEADSANLFEPFFTGGQTSTHTSGEFAYQSRGIGLGLSVVQRFVQMHHGTVAWRNENGGTTFDVYLPAKPPVP
jgi:signal transduction histidine kinase